MKIRGRKTTIQNHSLLARRLRSMASSFNRKFTDMTDEQKKAQRDLEEQALEHEIKASLFGDAFTMIL